MASWTPRAAGAGATSTPAAQTKPVQPPAPAKPKKQEKWLVTRKTWRYMADAGKLLIPESLRKGKDSSDDVAAFEEHFQETCDQQSEFIEWEGPKIEQKHLARVRPSTATSPPPRDLPEPTVPSFRLVLPVGQEPPPGYIQVGRRSLMVGRNNSELEMTNMGHSQTAESYVRLPSGLVVQELPTSYLSGRDWLARRSSSPADSGVLSPEDRSYDEDHNFRYTAESGIGSGTDSVTTKATHAKMPKRKQVGVQTDPLPEEYFRLYAEQKRREEEERLRKEEEERLAREAEERERKEMEELEAAMMGDSVMRYLKMVRRNSKTSDQKKAERFRSMNYDPTLRNIKAKYLNKEEIVLGYKKSFEVQVGESLLAILAQVKTPIDPPTTKLSSSHADQRKFSSPCSELSDAALSPQRRLSGVGLEGSDEVDGERDFFSHLYSGDMTSLESGAVPEDYYNYLESWYRVQKGLTSGSASGSGAPASSSSSVSVSTAVSASIYIPVDALQNLRASMPTLATSAAVTSTTGVSRSTVSLSKTSSSAQNFLTTVISARPWASVGSSSGSTGKIISKKLWRPRSKGRQTTIPAWTPQAGFRWSHLSNRQVILEPTNLLLLHEFERVAIQKLACQKLNNSDLGVNVRIPKEGETKQKRRTYLLKKKVLNKLDSKDKSKESCTGAVFGVPLSCCVETTSRKRSIQLDGGEESGPNASKSYGSLDNISLSDVRRQSIGISSTGPEGEETEGVGITSPSSSFGSLCVPTVVMMCIRHLEQFGLHTVGVFRVSSSKKRVRQLKDDFDRGGQITLTMETGVHDVATLLKEFFRDLPEPIIPKDMHLALLAIQKQSASHDQMLGFQRMMQLLPVINRDTLFVLLQFLGLVADNAEDKKGDDGTSLTGNKMDASNLATLFAPNLLHNFTDETPTVSSGISFTSCNRNLSSYFASHEKLEYVSIMKTLIEKRDSIFEVPTSELHDLYIYLADHFPDVLDALLCRRLALAGVDIPEDVEEYDEEEEEGHQAEKADPRRRGRFRKESDGSEGSSRWGFRSRDHANKEDQCRATSTEPSHGEGVTRGSFKFPGTKSRKLSTDGAAISDIFRRKASTKSASDHLHSPSSGTPSSEVFFGGSGNTTPSVTSPPPHGGHFSGFSSPVAFSPPMSPPPLQTTLPGLPPLCHGMRPRLGNVFAPASDVNPSGFSHQ